MQKTIKIGNQEVELNNNIGWTFIYRDQFGTDIIPTIMPVLKSIIDLFAGAMETVGEVDELSMEDIGRIMGSDKIIDALISLSGLEFVDFINITWALAKNADDEIKEPKIWVRQFDAFPVDEIAPALFEMVFKGMVSTKNWNRLRAAVKGLKPKKKKSASMTSSLPPSTED